MMEGSSYQLKDRSKPMRTIGEDSTDGFYYILQALFIFSLSIGMVISGGMLQWTLAVMIMVMIGVNIVIRLNDDTESIEEWEQEHRLDQRKVLELKDTSDIIERAFEGMDLSRALVEKQIGNIYSEKLKRRKNLTTEDLNVLLEDEDLFREVVDDEVISDFILSEKRKEWRDERDYKKQLEDLIGRIERWG